jgi:hypothetical protein
MEGSGSTASEEHSVSLYPVGAFCAINPVFFALAVKMERRTKDRQYFY